MLRGTAGTTTVPLSESLSQLVKRSRLGGTWMSSDGSSVTAAVGATIASSVINVERVVTLQSFLDLESEWADLLVRSETDRVFLTHQWFRCWWEAFGLDQQLFILCARRGGRLVGVAPLCALRSRFRGLPIRELRFLANDYSEECDFIVDAQEPGVLESIVRYLASARGEWDLLKLERLRLESPLWRQRAAVLEQGGLRFRDRPGMRVPYLKIDRSWEEFLAQKSRKFRKTHRNRLNTIQRHPEPVLVEGHVTSEDVAQALGSVFEVSAKSWKSDQGRAITSSREATRLFEALSRHLVEKGWVTLWLATVGGRPAAFEYHLTYGGVTAPIRADLDEAYRAISLGAHLEAEIYRSVFEHPEWGIVEYNTCADSYEYTMRWTKTAHEHVALLISAPGWYGRLLHILGGLRRPRRSRVGAIDAEQGT